MTIGNAKISLNEIGFGSSVFAGSCGFSILDPPGFIGGLDRLRIAFVQADAGKRLSLFRGLNSLCRAAELGKHRQ
jgi:hypothetical protein